MIKIARFVFNSILENTYVLYDGTGECVIVDAGNYSQRENETLLKFIEKNSLKPVMAVNTHGHIDHTVGVNYVKEAFGVPFAMSSDDGFLLESMPVHGRLYGMEVENIPAIDIDLAREGSVRFGDSELEIIKTPGHSPGHISLYSKESKFVLTGDTLFKGSIGRTDLPGGDYGQEMRSILGRLIPLGGDVDVFPGHGEASTISVELESNPFITEAIEGEVNF